MNPENPQIKALGQECKYMNGHSDLILSKFNKTSTTYKHSGVPSIKISPGDNLRKNIDGWGSQL